MTRDQIVQALYASMEEVLDDVDPAALDEGMSLRADFGADSIEVMEIVGRTTRALRLQVRRTALADLRNLGELVDALHAASRVEA
ncbi:MAG: hypothetical protein H6735_25315 [Alphaproteobacteria bacterium]|nr:hypothetical protein [Alphaproteobacteria bacterium]